MLPSHEEPENLQIRCPACGQRFKVGVDLRDRTVECGACEHRFRIDDETIMRTKKFYPGERRDVRLDGFARVPHEPLVRPNIQMAQYAAEPSHASFEPPSPLRTLAGIVAVIGMIAMAALLFFGAKPEGTLEGVSVAQRLALAGFAVVLGGGMLVYANPRGRAKAIVVAAVFAAILLSLPILCQGGAEPLGAKGVPVVRPPDVAINAGAIKKSEKLADVIGLDPLLKENARLQGNSQGTRAVGVWLRSLRLSNRGQVYDYLVRSTGADLASHLFPRGDESALVILSGITLPIEEIAALSAKLGHDSDSIRVHADLGVVEVMVDNNIFVEGPFDKLQDKANPAFYDLNRRELESIDLERSRKAVKRIAEAEPKIYRDDITRQLAFLARDADAAMLGDISRALSVWAQPGDTKSVAAVAAAFEKLNAAKTVPPRDVVNFLVSRKAESIAPTLDALWAQDPTAWEQPYGDLGPIIEPLVIKQFEASAISQLRQSAARLLGRVGGSKSVAILNAAAPAADVELKVVIERSLKAIRER